MLRKPDPTLNYRGVLFSLSVSCSRAGLVCARDEKKGEAGCCSRDSVLLFSSGCQNGGLKILDSDSRPLSVLPTCSSPPPPPQPAIARSIAFCFSTPNIRQGLQSRTLQSAAATTPPGQTQPANIADVPTCRPGFPNSTINCRGWERRHSVKGILQTLHHIYTCSGKER